MHAQQMTAIFDIQQDGKFRFDRLNYITLHELEAAISLLSLEQSSDARYVHAHVSYDSWMHGLARVDDDTWHYYVPIMPSDE